MGPAGTYTIFKQGEQPTGGCMTLPQEAVPSHWLSYINVDDVDASTNKAKELGAQVFVEPTDIPDIGRFSVIKDPTGATLGLYKHTSMGCDS